MTLSKFESPPSHRDQVDLLGRLCFHNRWEPSTSSKEASGAQNWPHGTAAAKVVFCKRRRRPVRLEILSLGEDDLIIHPRIGTACAGRTLLSITSVLQNEGDLCFHRCRVTWVFKVTIRPMLDGHNSSTVELRSCNALQEQAKICKDQCEFQLL